MDWAPTPNERSALEQQEFIEALLKVRSGQTKRSDEEEVSSKPNWLRFLESTGGAAIITVMLGTLGGAIITGIIQSHNQRQEARRLSLSEYIKGEHDTVKSAFDMIGECIAASENLNAITTSGFNPANFPSGHQRNLVLAQKENLRNGFNKTEEHWRATRESLTLNMRYYNGDDKDVDSAWDLAGNTVSTYMDCQDAWYTKHMGSFADLDVAEQACGSERKSLDSALANLGEALAKNRLYQFEQ
jgi:hypothetical protein